ncbi:MAG: DedA family protein [Chloroflexi bacterium]|nr:DedA family protein [Chloroflexota bacterium]
MDFVFDKLGFFAAGPYLGVFFFFLLGDAGVPLPVSGSFLLMYSGYLVREGKLHLAFLMLAATIGVLVGAVVLYFVAKRGGAPLLARYGARIGLGQQRRQRVEGWVNGHGFLPVALGRMLPGVHTHTAAISGLFKVPFKPFVTGIIVADILYVSAYLFLGAAMTETIGRFAGDYLRWVMLAPLAVGVSSWFIISRVRRFRAARMKAG